MLPLLHRVCLLKMHLAAQNGQISLKLAHKFRPEFMSAQKIMVIQYTLIHIASLNGRLCDDAVQKLCLLAYAIFFFRKI